MTEKVQEAVTNKEKIERPSFPFWIFSFPPGYLRLFFSRPSIGLSVFHSSLRLRGVETQYLTTQLSSEIGWQPRTTIQLNNTREKSNVLEDLLITWPKPDHTRLKGAEVGRTQRKRRASRARRGKSFSNAGHCTAGCELGADHNRNVAPSRGSNHLANSEYKV